MRQRWNFLPAVPARKPEEGVGPQNQRQWLLRPQFKPQALQCVYSVAWCASPGRVHFAGVEFIRGLIGNHQTNHFQPLFSRGNRPGAVRWPTGRNPAHPIDGAAGQRCIGQCTVAAVHRIKGAAQEAQNTPYGQGREVFRP